MKLENLVLKKINPDKVQLCSLFLLFLFFITQILMVIVQHNTIDLGLADYMAIILSVLSDFIVIMMIIRYFINGVGRIYNFLWALILSSLGVEICIFYHIISTFGWDLYQLLTEVIGYGFILITLIHRMGTTYRAHLFLDQHPTFFTNNIQEVKK